MLYLTNTVGFQSAIYDSDDGTLEWVDNKEIKRCMDNGLQVIKERPVIRSNMCNINKDRSNLFEGCKFSTVTGDSVVITNKFGKKFKGKVQGNKIILNVGLIVLT